jgi:hypothetical protein
MQPPTTEFTTRVRHGVAGHDGLLLSALSRAGWRVTASCECGWVGRRYRCEDRASDATLAHAQEVGA